MFLSLKMNLCILLTVSGARNPIQFCVRLNCYDIALINT